MGGAAKALFKTYGKSGIADRAANGGQPGDQQRARARRCRCTWRAPAWSPSIRCPSSCTAWRLNITIQTYAGRVDFGIIADKKAVPHVQDLADALEAAFEEAKALFVTEPVAQAAAKRKAAVRPRRRAAA